MLFRGIGAGRLTARQRHDKDRHGTGAPTVLPEYLSAERSLTHRQTA